MVSDSISSAAIWKMEILRALSAKLSFSGQHQLKGLAAQLKHPIIISVFSGWLSDFLWFSILVTTYRVAR